MVKAKIIFFVFFSLLNKDNFTLNKNNLTFRYFNNYYVNCFLSKQIIAGKSKHFKKKFLKLYYFKLVLILQNKSLTQLLNYFNLYNDFKIFFSNKSSITYKNHKKKYISTIVFSILKPVKRKFFFLKFLKNFFFFNFYYNINTFIKNTNCIAVKNSIIYRCYKRLYYRFVFKS